MSMSLLEHILNKESYTSINRSVAFPYLFGSIHFTHTSSNSLTIVVNVKHIVNPVIVGTKNETRVHFKL